MAEDQQEVEEKKLYKGDDITVGDLLAGKVPRFAPLQSLGDFSGTKDSYGYWRLAPAKLDRLLYFDRVIPDGNANYATVVLKRRKEFRELSVNLPKDFKLRALSGRLAGDMRKEVAAWAETAWASAVVNTPVTLGSDPEIFVEHADGSLFPAFEFLGSKANPDKGPTNRTYGGNALYWDGFQAEFTTTAQVCLQYHADSIQAGLEGILTHARKKDPGARLSLRSVVEVSEDIRAAAAPEHVEFGCMPSKNAYGMTGNVHDGRSTPFRFAGGHIHLGCGTKPTEQQIAMVQAMDAIAGVAGVSLFAAHDSPVRRAHYGQAGEYRTPPHGIEYRVLSNAWLMHPITTMMMFDITRQAARLGESELLRFWKSEPDEWVPVIQECNVEGARDILTRNAGTFKQLMATVPSRVYRDTADLLLKCVMGGAEGFVARPADIEGNWLLCQPHPLYGPTSPAWLGHSESPGCTWNKSKARLAAGEKL